MVSRTTSFTLVEKADTRCKSACGHGFLLLLSSSSSLSLSKISTISGSSVSGNPVLVPDLRLQENRVLVLFDVSVVGVAVVCG